MAYLMKTNGDIKKVKPSNHKVFTLSELQHHVGGYIEMVQLLGNQILVVNDEGKIRRLPINNYATLFTGIEIYGDVIVLDENETDAMNNSEE